MALFVIGISLKKSWPRGDSNLRRWSQSTNILRTRPSYIPKKDESKRLRPATQVRVPTCQEVFS